MATAITIGSPKAYQVFQRNGSNQSTMLISGTYTGSAPSGVQARWSGGSWTSLTSTTIAGGNYVGTLAAQTGGQGTLEVRDTGVPATTASVAYIGVGDVFLVCGQSNSAGELTNYQSYSHATLKAGKYDFSNSAWEELTDPSGANTARGSVWPLLATRIMAHTSVPVAFVCCAVGGTRLYASPAHWSSGGANYIDTVARVAASKVNGFKCILFYQGESDALEGVSAVNYRTALSTFVTDLCTSMGLGDFYAIVALIGSTATATDANLNAIRQGIIYDWINDGAHTKSGPVAHDQLFADGTHWSTDEQANRLADRWWRCILRHGFSGSETARGPVFASAVRVGSQVTVTFTNVMGAGLQAATATGWDYIWNGTPLTVTSATVTSATTIVLTLGSNPATGTETITFASGDNAAGSQLRDASAYAEFPPEPIYAESVSATGSSSSGRGWYR